MNDPFERKVHAAAIAGWWVLLIAAAFLLLQTILYHLIMSTRPAWFLALCGPDISWSFVQNLWLWVMSIFKMCLWLLALVAIWLTLWARQLPKRAGGE